MKQRFFRQDDDRKIMKWMRKDAVVAWLFLAPSAVGFALFYLVPFIMGVFYSFVDSPVDRHFAGLDNYRELLMSESFRKAVTNTFYFSAVSVPLNLTLSLGLAVLLNQIYICKNGARQPMCCRLSFPLPQLCSSGNCCSIGTDP